MSQRATSQQGFAVTIAIVAIGFAAALGLASAYSFRQAKATSFAAQSEQVRGDLSQLAKQLSLLSIPDVASILTAPAFVAGPVGSVPSGGGRLPVAISTRTTTPQGISFGYCPVKLGDAGSAGNRIPTGGSPGASTILFALVSPGPDRSFQTTCAQAVAGTATADDQVFRVRHNDAQRLVYEAQAIAHGHAGFQAAGMRCAADGKLFLPYATAKDVRGCK